MSTRSYIGVECEDGIRGVYCHFDGYLSGVGDTLKQHYTDFMKVCTLINGGNISSLGAEINEKHNFDTRPDGWTTYYGRDRGEKDQEYNMFKSESIYVDIALNSGAEFIYLFKNGKWYYTESDIEYFKEF